MKPEGRLKILLMGDMSNFHNALAVGLRRLGHDVTVASNGTRWMNTARDIDTKRRGRNKFYGLRLYLRLLRLCLTELRGYDIVSIAGCGFVDLRPHRIRRIYKLLRRANSHMFLMMGDCDAQYTRVCLDRENPPFRYSEWIIDGRPSPYNFSHQADLGRWLGPKLTQLSRMIYDDAEGIVTALYEYDVTVRRSGVPQDKVAYGGIPIDTASVAFEPLPQRPEKVKIFLGRHLHRLEEKGTDRLERAARIVAERHPHRCELRIVENMPYEEYVKTLRDSHIVLDQLYSYTPSTNALLAMAMGKVVVSGAEPEFYDFIGEHELQPIVNADPLATDEQIAAVIEQLVLHPERLPELGRQGRAFVEKHNDTVVVARRFLDFWTSKITRANE